MLFVIYLLQTGQLRIESEIKYIRLYEFEKIVASDMEQIKRDYYIIAKKIMEGKASELSEGDTEFLGAARRGDKNSKKQDAPKGDKALPRRFAFKQSYMIDKLEEKNEGYIWMMELLSKLDRIKVSSKKIGNAQRMFFQYFYRELLNSESDSYLNLDAAVQNGYKKYYSQVI